MVNVTWQSGGVLKTGKIIGFVAGFDPQDKSAQNPCRTMAIVQTPLGKLVQVYIDALTTTGV